MKVIAVIGIVLILILKTEAQIVYKLFSPDKTISVFIENKKGRIYYSVLKNSRKIIQPSLLGIDFTDKSFLNELKIVSVSKPAAVQEAYQIKNAKKSSIQYKASKTIITVLDRNGLKTELIFQLSNDGLAFRYYFPWIQKTETIIKEYTSFAFDSNARVWMQPMSVAKSGWEQCNPAYEEHYYKDVPAGTVSHLKSGWVYPALFKTNDMWALITEAGMDGTYCGTRLINDSASSVYSIGFPGNKEIFTGKGHLPNNNKPWYSPWRVIVVGGLNTIAESTLGTDVAPATTMNTSYIKPGKASWSWINSKDDMIVYDEQKKYIDFASSMKWQYCLIDVNWDTKIGYDKINELAQYGKQKNVGLILWYNSAGDWNTVKYHPKDMLLTKESREKEFSRLQAMGIKGVKIDFFGGDGQSVMQYYIDILNDAAKFQLLVNFHGATLPRGWHKTYPNLISAEGVYGMEMVTFGRQAADAQPSHCAILPFTRNAFDPMDFTPMNLTGLTHSKSIRKTTPAFELALSVLFLSGVQHYAQNPEAMNQVPEYVKIFLQTLPDYWDDVKFIDGYPGNYIVVARRSRTKWYLAGINGENKERKVEMNISAFKKIKAMLITDSDSGQLFGESSLPVNAAGKISISMKPNGGFVAVLN